jgi:diguanylate cyclase (GGDEF)-like protein
VWHDRNTRLLLAVATAGTLAAALPVAPVLVRVWVAWLLFTAVHLGFAADSWRTWRDPRSSPSTRRLWRAFFVTGLMFVVGDLVQLVALATQPWSMALATGTPPQQALALGGTALALVAALAQPLRLGPRQEQLRYRLDIAVVLVAVAAVGVYAMPSTPSGDRWSQLQALVLGPVIFSVVGFAVLKLATTADQPFVRTAGRLIGLAALGEASLTLVTMRADLATNLVLINALALSSNALLALAARVQRTAPIEPPRPRPTGPQLSRMPYVAIVVTNALLVWTLVTDGLSLRTWVVLGATVVGTLLVLVRQLLALSESSWLLGELDRRLDELGRAMSERDELTARLQDLAYHDGLTGLANRSRFDESLELAVDAHRGAGRDPNDALTVLLVDLDGFKEVNDTHGHTAGDALLVEVARRLRACVRSTDVVARLGGDEFCLLLTRPPASAAAVAERIVTTLGRPFLIGDTTVQVGASVGLATLDRGTRNGHELVRRADAAMYTAKRLGKGRVQSAQGIDL